MDRGSSFVGNPSPPSPHRISDVLQVLRTHIFESDIDPAADLALRVVGDANAARLRDPLKARGNVDAVAEDVIVIDDDVT